MTYLKSNLHHLKLDMLKALLWEIVEARPHRGRRLVAVTLNVTPMEIGVQVRMWRQCSMDSGLRQNDGSLPESLANPMCKFLGCHPECSEGSQVFAEIADEDMTSVPA